MTITHKDENGGFGFDFTQAQNFVEFDTIFRNKFHGLMVVDFCFESGQNIIMIEVKDPSAPKIPDHKLSKLEYLKPTKLIKEELVPKVRDSYLILHLNNNLKRNLHYIVLIGNDRINLNFMEIETIERELRKFLKKENDHAWLIEYVQDCYVLTEKTWDKVMEKYPLERITLA